MTLMEDFFPMEVPPGHHSTMVNWRKMAQLWCADGVIQPDLSFIPTERNPLSVYGWDWANHRASVAPGACWINGFYGQLVNTHTLEVGEPPNWGLVVARFDPVAQVISVVFKGGNTPADVIRDPVGWWEIPLAQMNSDGGIADLRRYVPLPDLAPQLPGIPSWVPRGMLPQGGWGWTAGPPATTDYGQGVHNIQVLYPSATAWWVPGRTYRYTVIAAGERWADGSGIPTAHLSFYVRDQAGERRREVLLNHNQFAQGSGFSGQPRSTTLTIGSSVSDVVAVVELNVVNVGAVWRFAPNSVAIACEDVGL